MSSYKLHSYLIFFIYIYVRACVLQIRMVGTFCETYADKENYTRGSRRMCVTSRELCFLLD